MRITVFSGYLIDHKSLDKWSEAQTDPKYVEFRSDPCATAFHALDAYLEHKKWDRIIGLEVLPGPKGVNGKTTNKRWNLMFYRRNRTYDIPLRRFSDWNRHQELDADLQCKKLIEDLGLSVSAWTTVSWVGHKGLFYDFSPDVLSGIIQRMELAKEQKAKNAEEAALSAPVVDSAQSS